jgi:predicted membrane protein
MKSNGRFMWGLVLIGIGLLFLLEHVGLWNIGDLFRDYWPVLLILWGVYILFRRRQGSSSIHAENAPFAGPVRGDASQELLNTTNVLGEVEISVLSKNFRGGSVSTVFGDIAIDCTAATVADGENYLNVHGVFGGLRIKLPKETAFAVSANTLFGSVAIKDDKRSGFAPSVVYETPGYQTSGRKLRLRCSQVFGDVEIRQ